MGTLIALNGICLLLAAAGWLALRRVRTEEQEGRGFAAVLAGARQVAERLAGEEAPLQPLGGQPRGPLPPVAEPGAPAEAVPPLPVATRMAAIRLMLQGRPVVEAAAALGVSNEAVRALYRLHGRGGEGR